MDASIAIHRGGNSRAKVLRFDEEPFHPMWTMRTCGASGVR
jgi:hypothetical protein